jgi:hypothetical protein
VSDLIPDPVEDRLRRTFATRAEDMASGDAASDDDQALQRVALDAGPAVGAGGHAGRSAGHNGTRGSGRLLLAAAIVVIFGAAVAAAVVVGTSRDGDRGRDEPRGVAHEGDDVSGAEGAEAAEVVPATRELVVALEDERNLASLELMGATGAIDVEVSDPDEVRTQTDAAIAALRAALGDGPAASSYQQAIDDLAGLDALRGQVDADDGPHDLGNLAASNDVFARYASLASGLLDAEGELALAIDDPALRSGVQVHQLGLRQQELTGQLVRAVLVFAIEPGSAATSETAQLEARFRQGQEELRAAADGTPYEAAATEVLDQVEASGLMDAVTPATQGEVDLSAVLAAVDLGFYRDWLTFFTRVERMLT